MNHFKEKVAGALIFIAVTQFVLGLIASEATYPNYSISDNYISDLGVGPSSIIFNMSVFFMGLLLIVGTYFLQRAFNFKLLTALLVLTAIGAMGVGIFTEDFGPIHSVVSLITFLFGGLSAVYSGVYSILHKDKLISKPFAIIAIVLGFMSLGALALFIAHINLSLGVGGMERMIVYPLLMWGAGFGGILLAHQEKT